MLGDRDDLLRSDARLLRGNNGGLNLIELTIDLEPGDIGVGGRCLNPAESGGFGPKVRDASTCGPSPLVPNLLAMLCILAVFVSAFFKVL